MAKNTWYKPGGQDADSKIADDIDKILSSTGIDQGSETFWREFESRLKVAVPHRYKASAPAERRQTGSSGPPVSGGRIGREVKGKTLIRLSPERMSILKEKGIDPSSDEAKPLLRAFMQYDKENKINTR